MPAALERLIIHFSVFAHVVILIGIITDVFNARISKVFFLYTMGGQMLRLFRTKVRDFFLDPDHAGPYGKSTDNRQYIWSLTHEIYHRSF